MAGTSHLAFRGDARYVWVIAEHVLAVNDQELEA